jgi:hypothetical protein
MPTLFPHQRIQAKAALVLLCSLSGCGGGTLANLGVPDAGALQWFRSCPSPICQAGDAGVVPLPGVSACTTQRVGEACAPADAACDPGLGCGVHLVCAASDPTQKPFGCPISSRELKNDIRYLDAKGLLRVASKLENIRLATYTYKSDPAARERLGFIIEDDPSSPAVGDSRSAVDLYGYTSMVVAAMKVQAQKLEKQDAEIKALRLELDALRRRGKARSR